MAAGIAARTGGKGDMMIEATVFSWHKPGATVAGRPVEVEVDSSQGDDSYDAYGQILVADDDGRVFIIALSPADFERLGQAIMEHSAGLE